MKILCYYRDCGPSYVFDGWRKVMEACGHKWYWWPLDRQPKIPAFQIFDEVNPDLFIGTTFDLDQATYKCIKSRPQMKVALYASAWGELISKIDTSKYPLVVANPDEKDWLARLKRKTSKPDLVFLHYPDKYIEQTLGGWNTIGIRPIGLMNAADTFDYYPASPKDEYKCDIAFVGGYWGYKSKNLERMMVPLMDKYKVKIFGNQPWPFPQYLGFVPTSEVKHIFASAKVCVNISEPHSTDFGFDLVERPFKVLASGACCISDKVDGFREVFTSDELPMPKTNAPVSFLTMVEEYIKDEVKRTAVADKGKAAVLRSETYWHRCAKLFMELGLVEEASRVIDNYHGYMSIGAAK